MCKSVYLVSIGSNFAINSDSEPPPCVHEKGIYYASVSRSYNGPLRLMIKWSDPWRTHRTILNGETTTTATETAGTVFNFKVYASLSPETLQYNITSDMYFQSPSSVIVPGTQQATNAPGYRHYGLVPLRPTVFVREYFL